MVGHMSVVVCFPVRNIRRMNLEAFHSHGVGVVVIPDHCCVTLCKEATDSDVIVRNTGWSVGSKERNSSGC